MATPGTTRTSLPPGELLPCGSPTARVVHFPATQSLPITLLLRLLFMLLLPNQLSIEKGSLTRTHYKLETSAGSSKTQGR